MPGLLEIEDGRIAHAFLSEPGVPFVPSSRRKGLGQEVLDRITLPEIRSSLKATIASQLGGAVDTGEGPIDAV